MNGWAMCRGHRNIRGGLRRQQSNAPTCCSSLPSRLRSHRIGQTKEVRVIHLEAVADAPRPPPPPPGQPPPARLYADSIESLVGA